MTIATLETLVREFRTFILKRPGFESGNYVGAPQAYRADYRTCLRDRDDALLLLSYVARASDPERMRDCIVSEMRSGRLEWNHLAQEFEYTAGQYYAVEYRRAACRLLAYIVWMYWRTNGDGSTISPEAFDRASVIRTARFEFGKRIASRWFD
jgi:hypothetical protein